MCSFPAFSAHLPKVRNRPGPSVGPVPAFSFPAAFSHLPKVCSFPAFSAHLPKHGTLFSAYARVSVSSRLLPPSEGVQFSRVFCSPSEGAQSSGALCRACTRVFVSSRLLPPSEGVQFSRVFCSPSEDLPKVRNRPGPFVGSVPAFLFPAAFSHLPKVRNLTGPSLAPMPAFLFPAASFHLPKAGQIRQYPYHLWKVSTSIFSATAADSAFLGKGPGRQYCLENL